MLLKYKRYDFVNMRVTEHEREIPNEPPETALLAVLRKRSKAPSPHKEVEDEQQ